MDHWCPIRPGYLQVCMWLGLPAANIQQEAAGEPFQSVQFQKIVKHKQTLFRRIPAQHNAKLHTVRHFHNPQTEVWNQNVVLGPVNPLTNSKNGCTVSFDNGGAQSNVCIRRFWQYTPAKHYTKVWEQFLCFLRKTKDVDCGGLWLICLAAGRRRETRRRLIDADRIWHHNCSDTKAPDSPQINFDTKPICMSCTALFKHSDSYLPLSYCQWSGIDAGDAGVPIRPELDSVSDQLRQHLNREGREVFVPIEN